MTFREAMEDDVKNAFLDIDTFGEIHTVNGEEMVICIQDGVFTEPDGRFSENRKMGIFSNSLTMYVSADNLRKPKAGAVLDIDGKFYEVIAAINEGGIRRIVLRRYDSR
ncbi:MAG: hypothetical protein J1F64_07170 [Oscillospiraceae bacterium]|nr:hypothetical protein [Oscillospiraceae bacterium]